MEAHPLLPLRASHEDVCSLLSAGRHLGTASSPGLQRLNLGRSPLVETAVIWPVSSSCWCNLLLVFGLILLCVKAVTASADNSEGP